jgi:hypothetical protein
MVCDNSRKRPLDINERCEILGLSLARAYFLLACAKDDTTHSRTGPKIDRGQSIPYDPGVLIREAFRLGISLKDTATMMEMTSEQIAAYGLPFRARSAFSPPPGQSKIYNLFPPEPNNQ